MKGTSTSNMYLSTVLESVTLLQGTNAKLPTGQTQTKTVKKKEWKKTSV